MTNDPEVNPGDEASPNDPATGDVPCEHCGGTGEHDGTPCPECGGAGTVTEVVGGG